MRQILAQQLLATLQVVGASVYDSVGQSFDVVSGGSGLELVQKRKEIVALVHATNGELAQITGVDRHRWSRYLVGKVSITEKILSRIAPRLDMTPGELLSALLERREKNRHFSK